MGKRVSRALIFFNYISFVISLCNLSFFSSFDFFSFFFVLIFFFFYSIFFQKLK